MKTDHNHRITISSFAAFALLMSIILGYYGYGTLNAAIIVSIIMIVVILIKRRSIKLIFPKPLLLYIFYVLIMSVLCGTSISDKVNLGLLFMFLLWGIFNAEITFQSFLKLYRRIAWINIIFFFIQEIAYYTFGHRPIGLITSLPITIDLQSYLYMAATAERSSGFFSEPAHFAQFLSPLLSIELFLNDSKKSKVYSVIYVAVLLLLKSGNAILFLFIITICYIFYLFKKSSFLRLLYIIPTILVFIIGSVIVIFNSEYGAELFERKEEISKDQTTISSGFIRIYRGFYVWDELSVFEKIIGLNSIDRLKDKIQQSPVYFTFGDNDLYFNGVQNFLLRTGILGTLIFSMVLLSLWKRNHLAGKCCILCFIGLSMMASVYITYTTILYLVSAFLVKKENSVDMDNYILYLPSRVKCNNFNVE